MIVVAAGTGTRFADGSASSTLPKQYHPLAGKTVLRHTLEALDHPAVGRIIVAVHRDHQPYSVHYCADLALSCPLDTVDGGASRTASVRSALKAIPPAECSRIGWIGIHDGARPLLSRSLLDRLLHYLQEHPDAAGVVPALPCTDTIVSVDDQQRVSGGLDRRTLRRVQTPQLFRPAALLSAYARLEASADASDDASVLLNAGYPVGFVEGDARNLKVTTKEDLWLAERWMTT